MTIPRRVVQHGYFVPLAEVEPVAPKIGTASARVTLTPYAPERRNNEPPVPGSCEYQAVCEPGSFFSDHLGISRIQRAV
jgi:hypothetical protein